MGYDIYLSPTLKDLREERDSIVQVLTKGSFGVKQSYSASENNLISSCCEDVAMSSVYIGVIGLRYGYCPVDPKRNPDQKSITRLEFEIARERNIPCFIFIKSDECILAKMSDRFKHENGDGALIDEFRADVSSGQIVRSAVFSTLQELREMVLDKVSDFRRYAEGTKSVLNPERTHPAELAKDVALIVPAGSDAELVSSIDALCTDRRFKLVPLAPELRDYLRQLDAQTKDCRAICWLLTPTAISAYESPPQVLGRALKIQRLRRGSCTAFLAEGASASGTAMAHRSSRRCVSSVRPRLTTHRATSTSTSTTPTCRSERRRRSGSAAGHDTETTSAESNPGRAEKRALKARFTRFLAAADRRCCIRRCVKARGLS